MDKELKAYMATRQTRQISGASVKAYGKSMEKVTAKIADDIREGDRLAALLRVPEVVAKRARGKRT